VVAADRRCHLPLSEAAVQARQAEVLAQSTGIFGVAEARHLPNPRLVSRGRCYIHDQGASARLKARRYGQRATRHGRL
jgi:hypothetical protein